SPTVGSSSMYRRSFPPFPLSSRAILILCASPPESVGAACPSLMYPSPTSCSTFSFRPSDGTSKKKLIASFTVSAGMSSIFLFLYLPERTSLWNLFPPHSSHVTYTSARKCISISCTPAPSHVSHLPPATLNEKCDGVSPFDFASHVPAITFLISSYAFI